MSRKKQRKKPPAKAGVRANVPTSTGINRARERTHRVFLRDPVYITATSAILVVLLAGMLVMQLLGWFEGVVGSVLSVLVGLFACMCVFDLSLLLTAGITAGGGIINAGKDEQGTLMMFHASRVRAVEVRDALGHTMEKTASGRTFQKCLLTFVMEDGRTNVRPMHRLTEKQLARVRQAVEEQKKFPPLD